jgi:chemotaxis methyl-accepting protein methylase
MCDHIVFAGARARLEPHSEFSRRRTLPPSLTTRPAARTTEEAIDPELAAWLRSHHRINPDRYRRAVIDRRRAACLRAAHATSVTELAENTAVDALASEKTLSALLIGVTRFFRDPHVFGDLESRLVALHARRGSLNILSLACSDGQETYSLAMILASKGLLATSRITGIDRREDAVRAAHAALYPIEMHAEIPPHHAAQYTELLPSSRAFRIRPELRSICTFIAADAFHLPIHQDDRFDIILCRNFAIYLQPQASLSLWESLSSRLAPCGLLVVGKAERPSIARPLSRVGPCIYRNTESSCA